MYPPTRCYHYNYVIYIYVLIRFLGHCGPFGVITFNYQMSERTIRHIVHTTCNAIWTCLSPVVMPPPSAELWTKTEEGFSKKWNYPNAVGALHGKYVVIDRSPNGGSLYFNYKTCSKFLFMALVDANHRFITVDVGKCSKNGDRTTLRDSQLGKKLFSTRLQLPPPKPLPNTNTLLPYVMVADGAFPLHKHVMRPFPGPQLFKNEPNKIYNYRHERARSVCENAFKMFSKRFRIYAQKLQVSPKHLDMIVLATACLHNFLKDDAKNLWQPGELESEQAAAGLQDLRGIGGNSSFEAFDIRENFKHYFVSPTGSTRGQRDVINSGRRHTATCPP